MEDYIDLHVHSTCSDGTYTPKELVTYAKKKNLKAFALTDHDTVVGVKEAMLAARDAEIELIPGIELSTSYKGMDIHILGLGIDMDSLHFQEQLLYFQEERKSRNDKMILALQKEGVAITREKMLELFEEGIWTRAHFAIYLEKMGYVKTKDAAFRKYIGDTCPCFVPREKVTPYQAINLIHKGNGFAVLAHPLLYRMSLVELEEFVVSLKKANLDGIEAIYTNNRWLDESNMKRLAKKYNLAITGGSDFHGGAKPNVDLGVGYGHLKVPYQLWKDLKTKKSL